VSHLGCKYNLYPDKPLLRHTVRGLVAGAATLAAPVAAVGAVALLAVGTTIGAPTYGTYRLVRHIRRKRTTRNSHASVAVQRDPIDEHLTDSDDDDLTRAIEASMETFREETDKKEDVPPVNIRVKDDNVTLHL
jgi:hypothetical protein